MSEIPINVKDAKSQWKLFTQCWSTFLTIYSIFSTGVICLFYLIFSIVNVLYKLPHKILRNFETLGKSWKWVETQLNSHFSLQKWIFGNTHQNVLKANIKDLYFCWILLGFLFKPYSHATTLEMVNLNYYYNIFVTKQRKNHTVFCYCKLGTKFHYSFPNIMFY